MSTLLSISTPATGAKARTMPSLCAAPSFKHYRRSTTSRAPRKRTFLVTMEKYNMELASPPGVASAFANNVAMLTVGRCFDDEAALFGGSGDGSGNNGNNGNNNNHNGGNNNFDGSSNNNGDSWRFAPVLSQALLGALALFTAMAVFPAQSRAMMSSASPSSARGGASPSTSPSTGLLGFLPAEAPAFGRASTGSNTSPSRPRSKVMHVACKGSTLVVPLTGPNSEAAKAAAPRRGPWQRAKIVDAPIELSGNEVAVLEGPQYRVRESMLV